MPEIVDVVGKEVLSTGLKHASTGDVKFAARDLDKIVESFAAVGSLVRAPVKLGHNVRQALAARLGLPSDEDGLPALGHISRLYRKGEKLLADFSGVPAKLKGWLDAGMWPTVSLELRTVKVEGREHAWTPTGVALCGDTLEADVGQSWFEDVLTDAKFAAVVLAGEKPDTFEASGDPIYVLAGAMPDEETETETDEPEKGDELMESDMVDPQILEALGLPPEADVAAAVARIMELGEPMAEEEITPENVGELAGMKADLKAREDEATKLREEVAELKNRQAKSDAEDLIDEFALKVAPAARDDFVALALKDPAGTRATLEKMPDVVALGEKGSSEGVDEQAAALAPSDEEMEIAAKVCGVDLARGTEDEIEKLRVDLMLDKAKDEGIHTPALETKLKANLTTSAA